MNHIYKFGSSKVEIAFKFEVSLLITKKPRAVNRETYGVVG